MLLLFKVAHGVKLFKDRYSLLFYQQLSQDLNSVSDDFDTNHFLERIMPDHFDTMEMKQRVSHTTQILHASLPSEFEQAITILLALVVKLEKSGVKTDCIEYLFLPEFVERYGLNHFDVSMAAFTQITPFISCEFSVRPFIIDKPALMLQQMMRWTEHANRRVRRLASEGFRPRLPWGRALSIFKEEPMLLQPMLLRLMDDQCELS